MVLPRMAALAEVVWSTQESKDFKNFSERLLTQFRAYEQKGYNYSPGNFTVAIKPISENGNLSVALSTEAVSYTHLDVYKRQPCKYPLSTYAAMITLMDKKIGAIMQLLKELDLSLIHI